jgi:opacity protein-like surface antigen
MKKLLLIAALLALLFPCVLSALDQKEAKEAQKAQVIADKAEIYLEANQHSIVIDTIPRGTTVTLFQSGKKNKKWLYISYLSKKRASQVTGFIASNRVEIVSETHEIPQETIEEKTENPGNEKESIPAEPENSEARAEEFARDEKVTSSDKESAEMEKELERLRKLLEEKEKQEKHAQEIKSKETVQQKQEEKGPEEGAGSIEQSVLKEKEETQQEEKQETTESVEKEIAAQQEAVEEKQTLEEAKKEETDENLDTAQKLEEQMEEETAFKRVDAQEEEEATTEKTQETEIEELPKVLTKVSVKVPRANIRLMPTTKSSIIHQVQSGVELKHMAKTGNWHRVNLAPNKEGIVLSGYIHNNIVNEIFETITPPPPEPEKIPEPEPEIIEEEPDPESDPVQEIPTLRKTSIGEYYWVGGGAGYTMPSESNFEKGINIGGTFGFGVMKHLAIELRVPYFQSDVMGKLHGLSSGRLSSLSMMLSVQGRFPIKNRFVPYLVAGGDYHLNTFSLKEETTNSWNARGFNIQESVDHTFGFHFGTGLDVFLVKNIALNLDVRYYTAKLTGERTLSDQISQETTSIMINNVKLNSLQAGISVKLFLNPLRRKK